MKITTEWDNIFSILIKQIEIYLQIKYLILLDLFKIWKTKLQGKKL